ncbi:cilia- and flagella-associated protein 251-like [Pieris brassicae]|uniref:cilia- and flagella-associated protein 251-like n=1 Tax=Pieris brassicae TaxID=7116 RepID=UPI001E66182E|nr:cilia- and flagella-associated protein 251-like [Pieris brassicae]
MQSKSLEKFHSLPNIRAGLSEGDLRKLYSLSLSQIRKHAEFAEYNYKPASFNIRWIYGYNPRAGVINLKDSDKSEIFYAAGNCGVLYDWESDQMRILQGHRHVVLFLATDAQGKWLVTGDSGPENIIIIWDTTDLFPQKTLFSPHGSRKIAKICLSADAKYLMTLAYADIAVLHWWIWSFGYDVPHATLEVDISCDGVLDMSFNPNDSLQFLLLTKQDIWIGTAKKIFITERGIVKETDDYELMIRMPTRKAAPEVGRLTCFTFAKAQIVVGTSRGAVVLYSATVGNQDNVNMNYEELRFIKILKIEQIKINVIQSVDGVIVTGSDIGELHFYDEQLKLLYWIHGFQVDSVRGISFDMIRRSFKILDPKCNKECPCYEEVNAGVDPETKMLRQKLIKKAIPSDATTANKPFLVRDFILCTYNEGVSFVNFTTESLHTVLDNRIMRALTLTVHPEKSLLCVGYSEGLIELHNYLQHKLFVRLDLREKFKVIIPPNDDSIKGDFEVNYPELSVTCLKYSPSGLHLACGLDTGELLFLDPITIDLLTPIPFKDTDHSIKEINYSCDSITLAFADAGRTVCVYKYDCNNFQWQFVGKHRAHYKEITSVFFLPQKNADGEYKLLSLGADRMMVEYDIGDSSDEYLEILSLDRIDQMAIPLTGIPWPTPLEIDPEHCRTDIPMILVANDEHKYKIINNATTMTLSTILGPRFEHPVCRIELITRKGEEDDQEQKYLLFATKNVIGLQTFPLDGNPWKHAGLLGHPLQITGMCFREDSGTLFNIGAKDSCVYQWAANYRAVETTTKQGGGDLDPYYCLVEDGRPGWLFHEIRDLFYYIQILCQGTFSPEIRRVKDYIPIDSLPDMMRALGYFPSEYEVENLIVEAKFKVFQRVPSIEIDFEEFFKLYINHRPAFAESVKKVRNAFRQFATPNQNDEFVISRDDFVDLLSQNGEHFSRELSWYLLSILYGQSFEDRAALPEPDFEFIPEEITLTELLTNIIGVQDIETFSDYSTRESMVSQIATSSESEDA